MWFKNLLIYRFTKPFTLTPEDIDEKLADKAFKPCGSQDLSSCGWVSPLGAQGSELVHAANGRIMLCLQRQDKILPAAVVNEVLADKVAEIEERDGRKPGRKERTELKDEIVFELLPRAFSRSGRQFAYIDPKAGLLVVNSSSLKRAEEMLSLLRESLGSLPLVPVKAKNQVQNTLTQWLNEGAAGAGFELGGECELRDASDESAVIRCKHQDLGSKEINSHLQAGMYATKLELSWVGGIEFILDEQLAVKRLRFSDLIMDKAGEVDADSAAEQFDVDFTIMAGEFEAFIPALLAALGGEEGVEDETDSGAIGEPLRQAS